MIKKNLQEGFRQIFKHLIRKKLRKKNDYTKMKTNKLLLKNFKYFKQSKGKISKKSSEAHITDIFKVLEVVSVES